MRSVLLGSDRVRAAVLAALLVVVPLVAGIAVADQPELAPPLIVLVVSAVWFSVRGDDSWWDLLVLVLAGVYLLDYGFANIGVPGRVPIPIVDLVAFVLLARAASRPGFRWPASAPFVLAAAFMGLTLVRLSVDFPTYDVLAIRDATLGIELSYLFIGYWAIKEYGLERLVRVLSIVFLFAIAFVALYPIREAIVAASPQVGLQRPVPLFGNFTGAGTFGAAAFFFFALVRPFGVRSYAAAAAVLPLIALQQSRGLYVAIPVAILLVWLLGRARTGAQVRRGLAATLAVGMLALGLFFTFAPEGRLGKVSPSFVVAQLGTLVGHEGPSSGTVEVRKKWLDNVLSEMSDSSVRIAVGVGLGPDLASGITASQVSGQESEVLIRKPHNDYLEVFARYGVIGLVVFLLMLGSAFAAVIRGARRAEGLAGRFLWFAVAQSVVFGMNAASQPLLAFPYGTLPMFVVLGAALAVAERSPSTRRT